MTNLYVCHPVGLALSKSAEDLVTKRQFDELSSWIKTVDVRSQFDAAVSNSERNAKIQVARNIVKMFEYRYPNNLYTGKDVLTFRCCENKVREGGLFYQQPKVSGVDESLAEWAQKRFDPPAPLLEPLPLFRKRIDNDQD